MPGFCRDCLDGRRRTPRTRCAALRLAAPRAPCRARHARHRPCRLRRLLRHDREARRPALADKPLIIGGGKRGVVSTACYIARTFGVRSAMPMFEALRLCPHAIVVRPDMEKYVDGRPRGARADARAHAAGRAAVDRRGVPGPRPAPSGCTA